jgi:hypothetical protein
MVAPQAAAGQHRSVSGLQGFIEDPASGCSEPLVAHPGRRGRQTEGKTHMWTRFLLKPWWVRAWASAGVYAAIVTADWCARGLPPDPHRSWLYTITDHAASIVFAGFVVVTVTDTAHRAYANALAGLDPAQRWAAVDSALGGPMPVDAPVRNAAMRLARLRVQSAQTSRAWLMVLLGMTFLSALVIWPSGRKTAEWVYFLAIPCFVAAAWRASLSVERRLQTLTWTVDPTADVYLKTPRII